MKKLIILGEPKGKGRPRFTRNGHTYTPEDTKDYETLVKEEYKKQCEGMFEQGIPLELRIKAYFAIPSSAAEWRKSAMRTGQLRPTKKPDMDNIVKIVADSLNKVAYHDDAQVVSTTIEKWYGTIPRVEVSISEIVTVNNNRDTKNQGGIENV